MGVYTGLAKLGTKRWESRGYGGSGPARPEGPAVPVEETRFICPECREYFPFDADCPRCARPLVDRTVALPGVQTDLRRPLLGLPFKGSPLLYVLGLAAIGLPLAWVPAVEYFEGAATGGVLAVIGGLAGLAVGLPAIGVVADSLLGNRRIARARRRAREAALAIPCLRTTELPEEAPEPVRVAGRVRFDVGPTSVRVRVHDASGTAVLPARARIEVRSADGALAELDSVRAGDEVEVVGLGRRQTCAAEHYRACESEFEFGAGAPIQVWVRRPASVRTGHD